MHKPTSFNIFHNNFTLSSRFAHIDGVQYLTVLEMNAVRKERSKNMDYDMAAAQLMRIFEEARGGNFDMLYQHMKGEGFVLHILSQTQGAALPGQLCGATQTSSARVAATLGSLEQKGYITREIDPEDRRRILVRLTDEGRRAWETMHSEVHGRLEGTLRTLGETDTRELLRLAARLAEIKRSEREDSLAA